MHFSPWIVAALPLLVSTVSAHHEDIVEPTRTVEGFEQQTETAIPSVDSPNGAEPCAGIASAVDDVGYGSVSVDAEVSFNFLAKFQCCC